MSDTEALVDEAWALNVELDDAGPMWDSDIDHVERWFTTGTEQTADNLARAAALLGRLETAAGAAEGADRVSLLTAAAALRATAAELPVLGDIAAPHAEQGFLAMLHWAVNAYALVTAEHGARYHEKLRRFPAALEELRGRLRDAAADGRAPLRRHTQQAIERLDALLATPIAEDPFLAQAPPTELDDDAADAWRAQLAELVDQHARPALAAFRDTLATVSSPAGRDDDHPGLCHRPDGEAEYAALLAGYTRPGLDAETIHATGVEQLARLDEEWAAIGQAHFGVSDPSEVRRRTRAIPGRTTAEEVRRDAEAVFAASEEEAPSWFRRVPRSTCEVRTTVHGSLGFYSAPKLDVGAPGTTYLNVSDPTVWGPHLAVTVVHEGIPGHHYQCALALEDESLHTMHRRLFLPAYGEGWALYVERIGHEMGLYPTAVDQLGMLQSDAMRATRLVVDTGLHALGWTRQQAIDTMIECSGLGEFECTAEVDRYIAVPGQATSYMTGRLAIERLRDGARSALGAGFDIAAFHDVVLSNGMVSLDALDVLVEDWVRAAV